MIYLDNETEAQEISVPRSFGVVTPNRKTYLSTDDIAADLTTDSDTKALAASQGVVLAGMIAEKADADDVYTKTETDSLLDAKADTATTLEGYGITDAYTQTEVDALLADKADSDDVYTKTEADALLADKADADDVYTKDEADALLDAKQDVISDLATIRSGAELGATSVQPSDLATALSAKQDTLTFDTEPTENSDNPVTSGGVYDALQNAGSSDLFIAAYGTTTYAEVVAAYESGKGVIAIRNNALYILANYDSSYAYFGTPYSNNIKWLRVSSSNVWAQGMAYLQITTNLTTSLSSSSTNSQYPSAKAVYDALATKQDTLTAGTNITIEGNVISASGGGSSDPTGVISQTQTWSGSTSTGYTYVMEDIVTGKIPQANIDLFVAAGAVFNSTSGYFELNGLTDISYEEMGLIYAQGQISYPLHRYMFANCTIRTTLPLPSPLAFNYSSAVDMGSLFNSSSVEIIRLTDETGYGNANNIPKPSSSGMQSIFYGCNCLKDASYWNVSGVTSLLDNTNTFGAPSLERIMLYGLKVNAKFLQLSKLTPASVAYMINNAGTATITITLHATAYARAMADADVTTALASHTNVTLASA